MRLFSNVWSENTALFERLMEIHSNSPKLYYGFKKLWHPKFRKTHKNMKNPIFKGCTLHLDILCIHGHLLCTYICYIFLFFCYQNVLNRSIDCRYMYCLTLWRLCLKNCWTLMSVLYSTVSTMYVWWCSDGSINSQEYESFEIYAVTIKISMTE